MKELLLKVIDEEEWKPLRFTVYNYLDDNERYQYKLGVLGYDNSYEGLVGKTFKMDNDIAKQFKIYIEKNLQMDKVVVTVCVIDDQDYFTIVKPKDVDILSALNLV